MGGRKVKMRKQEFAKLFDRDAKPAPFVCMYPSCENDPIRSHSVTRAWLKLISDENNCVVTLRTKYETFFHAYASDNNPHPEITKLDIYNTKKLSTCYSFCSSHDASVFNQIDNIQDLDINRESAFLLAYRSISYEICVKRREYTKLSNFSVPTHLRPELEFYKKQLAFALECIGQKHKKMQNAILSDSYRDTRYYAVIMNSAPDILCSGFFSPVDEGNIRDQIYRSSYQHSPDANDQLALTIMPYQNDNGIIVLSWYGKSRKNKEYIKKLDNMSRNILPNYLFISIFQYIENFYIRPSFWDNLSTDKKESLHNRFESDINPNMTDLYQSVRSNNTKYVNWSVKDVRHNVW